MPRAQRLKRVFQNDIETGNQRDGAVLQIDRESGRSKRMFSHASKVGTWPTTAE